MTQPHLFQMNAEPLTTEAQASLRARSTDPATSHVAASEAVRFAGSHTEHIVAILRETQGALTTHEIRIRSRRLSHAQIHKRMAENEETDTQAGCFVRCPARPCRCNRLGLKTCDGTQPKTTWRRHSRSKRWKCETLPPQSQDAIETRQAARME